MSGQEMVEEPERLNNDTKKRFTIVVAVGVLLLLTIFILSLTQGHYRMTFTEALGSFWGVITSPFTGGEMTMGEKVTYHLRMPRSVAVILVGMGLAAAGTAMQAMIRNPLVDPYITGVSSGASFAVILVTLSGITGAMSVASIPLAATIGAIGAFALTMTMSEFVGGRAMAYVLSGTIIAAGLSSASTLVITFNSTDYESIMYWLFGTFAYATWDQVYVMLAVLIPSFLVLMLMARRLNIMLLGDENAEYLGLNTRQFKRIMMTLIAIITAMCVAYCGVIGFIGLIIPHLTRMMVGGDHRVLLPASMLIGAIVLLIADVFCKSFGSAGELPIGAIVSVVGIPFFFLLLAKEGKNYVM